MNACGHHHGEEIWCGNTQLRYCNRKTLMCQKEKPERHLWDKDHSIPTDEEYIPGDWIYSLPNQYCKPTDYNTPLNEECTAHLEANEADTIHPNFTSKNALFW